MWTFFFFSSNSTAKRITAYVLSYQWGGATLSSHSYIQNFNATGYLSASASMMVGGDGMLSNCNCQIAQARFYPDFAISDESFIRDVLSYGEPGK